MAKVDEKRSDDEVNRRGMLRLGGMAAAGAVAAAAASVAQASPAAAGVDGDVVLGDNNNQTAKATGIRVNGTTAGYGLGVTDNGASTTLGFKPSLFAHAKKLNFDT